MTYFFGAKKGVRLHPTMAMSFAQNAVASVFQYLQVPLILSSGKDGTHMVGSKHGTGEAFDISFRHLSEDQIRFVMIKLNELLTADFDVIREDDHIHLEYDPKE